MATSRTIAREEWGAFFGHVSTTLRGKQVEIEAASLELGDQIVAEWVPLLGITYDRHDDLLDVSLSGLNHLIRAPQDIYVQEGARGLETIAVVSRDDVTQILRLRDPLMLGPGSQR